MELVGYNHIININNYYSYKCILEAGVAQLILSDYGLDERTIEVRSLAEAKDFSSSLCVQSSSGAHPASCTMGTRGYFPRG
jgi:hypothetical protein